MEWSLLSPTRRSFAHREDGPWGVGGRCAACRRVLNLNGNRLNGSLPAELGALSAMQSLDLVGNAIVGSLPLSMSNWTDLTYVRCGAGEVGRKLEIQSGIRQSGHADLTCCSGVPCFAAAWMCRTTAWMGRCRCCPRFPRSST